MRAGTRAGYATWAWVLVFIAFHVYWYLGGRFGHPGPLPEVSFDVFGVVVTAMFVVGAVIPLAAVQSWGRAIPRRLLVAALWTGCAVLTLRGLTGILDDVLRTTGLGPDGLTGLTIEQVTGTAHPGPDIIWSGRATDACFTLGGLLFALTAQATRAARAPESPEAQERRAAHARR
ncbi:DUF3995 domain-containing protein [Nonomuraea sp. NPDC000554]|uniref:DUF3995 domain-containing protein n=1 Tax=Nonomuraea sp. NPDC000554 TaxID=3154259 RepID=UPI003317E73E